MKKAGDSIDERARGRLSHLMENQAERPDIDPRPILEKERLVESTFV